MIDERAKEGKVVCQIFEHTLEITLETHRARTRLPFTRIAPHVQLA
jgi:hypothetical protein